MNEETVWLYKVINAGKMSHNQLQEELDRWSRHITPHELIQQGDKLIIKYQSALNRRAYFEAARKLAENSIKYAAD